MWDKKGEEKMREVLYKNLTSEKNGRRIISVSEKSESPQFNTFVRRTFIYVVSREDNPGDFIPEPVFYISKYRNTATRTEKFSFRVKGAFLVVKDERNLKVHFCHSLRVDVEPK